MNNTMDLVVVLAIIGVACIYLYRRYASSKNNPGAGCGCGCDGGCGGCPTADGCDSDFKQLEDRQLPRS